MAKLKGEHAGKCTGPKTPVGKANSSGNATKHGCRAKKTLIVGDESEEDYDRLRAGWIEEFAPEGHQEWRLLEKLILNDWLQERAERQLLNAQAAVSEANPEATSWTAEQYHRVELMQRYKTTAERAFYRSWNAVQGLRRDFMREQREIWQLRTKTTELQVKAAELENKNKRNEERMPVVTKKAGKTEEPKTPAQELFQGQDSPKKQRKLQVLEQWVEVTVEDGKTVTRLTPSNEGLIRRGKKMNPPPEHVYRRLHFPNGVPQEYFWAVPPDDIERFGGGGIQRMTADTWLKQIEQEKGEGSGHIGPSGEGNLPRPKERGGCDCPTCSYNRELQEWRASKAEERAAREAENPEEPTPILAT